MTTETGRNDSTKKNILICDTQPVAVEGMKWLIENSGDLRFAGSVPTLEAVYYLLYPEEARAASEQAVLSAVTAAADALHAQLAESRTLESERLAAEPVPGEALAMSQSLAPNEAGTASEAPADAPVAETSITPLAAAVATAAESEAVYLPLEATTEPIPPAEPIDAIVIDKGLGFPCVMDLLQRLTANSHPTPIVVWGAAISEVEALRLLQAGARGIVRRTSESGTLLTCLRAVTSGGTWMEDGIFGSTEKLFNPRRSQLTHRESEVVVLVEKGLRNREIARMLGIQTGTVKIHLKHIFEKTGVRGRYGLAYTGLQNRGSIPLPSPPHFTAGRQA